MNVLNAFRDPAHKLTVMMFHAIVNIASAELVIDVTKRQEIVSKILTGVNSAKTSDLAQVVMFL
jgi:hypothetical protein